VFTRQHRGPKWDDGRIVKGVWNTETVEALQSYQLNLRRPVFQDIRVREAIALAFDFEQSNRYKTFKYADSLFNNSEFAAAGLPSPGELALLEPFRAELPKEVFGPPFRVPRTTDDPLAVRRNLLKARSLLEDAGWKLAPDGRLRNAKGEPLEFEYLAPGESTVREIEWARNLEKLGIKLSIRKVDYALFSRRLQEYDFDTTTIVEGHYTQPNVSDYVRLYGSKSADEKGNGNYRGVKSKAVDHVLDAMGRAETLQQLRDACRALDRIAMWSHWQVPQLFAANITLSYWNKFDMPAKRPRFFTVSVTQDLEPQLAWPELTWWPKA
jgi:microcin C transport system substrate-binding protein